MKTPRRLEPLLEEGIIDEVHSQLMSGKEAVCYVVSAGGEIRVAKVYKEANQRAFQNRAGYMEGRNVRSSRDRRAIHKRTTYGKKQLEEAWQTAEVDALFRMHAAGVRVPTPYVFSEGVLLMEMVQDDQERVAPRLSELQFGRQEALEVHRELMRQCALMLLGGLVHADLSEFNVLMAPSGPVIIDFPQAVDAAANNSARRIFVRDTDNLTRFLARFAPELRRKRYGDHIWKLFERGELTAEMQFDDVQVEVEKAPAPRVEGQGQNEPARSRRRAVVEIQTTSSQKQSPGGGDGRRRRGNGRPPEGRPADGPPGAFASAKSGPRPRRRGGGGGPPGVDRPAGSAPRPEGSSPRRPPHDSSAQGPRPRPPHDSSAQGPRPPRPPHDSSAQGPRPPRPPQEAGAAGAGDASDAPKRRKRRRRRRGGKPPAVASSSD